MSRVCSGCNREFQKTHLMLNHRRTFRCGGEWNEVVYTPTHWYAGAGDEERMIYASRPGARFSPDKPRLDDPSLGYTVGEIISRTLRKSIRKHRKRHKGRTPGAVRASRMPNGCGFRNNWEG
jgi:hypothetical protein